MQHINEVAKKGIDGVSGYLNWLGSLSKELLNNKKNQREIVFRPHPLFGRLDYYRSVMPSEIRWSNEELKKDCETAWACFAFNSNTVVEFKKFIGCNGILFMFNKYHKG